MAWSREMGLALDVQDPSEAGSGARRYSRRTSEGVVVELAHRETIHLADDLRARLDGDDAFIDQPL